MNTFNTLLGQHVRVRLPCAIVREEGISLPTVDLHHLAPTTHLIGAQLMRAI